MSSGGSPAVTNQTSKVELPAWVNEASQQNYQLAKDVSGRPLQQYGGQDIADPSAMTTRGYDVLGKSIGATQPLYGEAANLYRSSAGPLDIAGNLNPYTNEVEQRAIGNANTALTQQLRDIAGGAQRAGAFGGTRFGVQQGVAQAEGTRGIGDLSAALRSKGFDTAAALAQAEKARQSGAAQGLLTTAGGQQAATGQDIAGLLSAGGQEQGQRQNVINAAKQRFSEQWNYPVEQLNMRLAALGMSPYGKTETAMKTSTSEDKGPDWSTIGLGAFKTAAPYLLPFMFASDRSLKTDIKKLTDGDIPLYAYRYKGDPKSYPKIVGPMAQDIEKKHPKTVKKVGKHKVVDLNNLMEVLS